MGTAIVLMRSSKRNQRILGKSLRTRAQRIRIVLMDVDGVLTDGRIFLCADSKGNKTDIKVFHAHDGVGLKLARATGLLTGLITGRDSPAAVQRAREIGMDFVYQAQDNKLLAYEEILAHAGATDPEVCYIGDDLPDIPILKRVGLAVSVPNGAPEARRAAHYVTTRRGGEGAVREVIELILKARGQWRRVVTM